jgi:EmrB/QacA subfamily drug resistance transporter
MTTSRSAMWGCWLLFAACVLIGLLNETSGGVLTVALPTLRREIGASETGTQLILTTGKLFLGALILAGGALGDVYGRKRMLMIGAGIVAVASVLSGVANSQGLLVAARALDGIGNAMVAPLALAIAISGFPESRRAKVVSTFAGFSALGIALGPLAASLLVREVGWRLGFLLPLGVVLIGGAGVLLFAREPARVRDGKRVDYLGAVLCALGLLGVVFGCARATSAGWVSREVLVPLAIGVLLLGAFSYWERRAKNPLVDTRLFRNRTILITIIVVVAISLAVSGSFLPLFYFLQAGQHHPPVGAVVRLLPLVIAAAVFAPVVGVASTRFGHRRTIIVGLFIAAIGCSVLAVALHPGTPYPVLLLSLVLLGIGNIAVIGAATDLVLGSVPEERRGGAAAMAAAAAQVGAALGIPIMVSALMSAARPVFYERMREVSGLPDHEIREAVRVIRQGMGSAASERSFEVPALLREQIQAASEVALGIGVNRCFVVAVVACILCSVVVWAEDYRCTHGTRPPRPRGMLRPS